MADSTKGPTIFISYSHKDKKWLQRLQTFLAPLLRQGRIVAWDDEKIQPGTLWREEISKALEEADVAVLLVSSDFLASDFIANNELPKLLTKQHIFWIPISASLYSQTEIAKYQATHDPKKPLNTLSRAKQDEALTQIFEKILAVVPAAPRSVAAANAPPVVAASSSTATGIDEGKVTEFLEGLTSSDLGRIITRFSGASAQVPDSVDHYQRVAALLRFVRSSNGPGMPKLVEIIVTLFKKDLSFFAE